MRTWLIRLMMGAAASLVFCSVATAQGSGTGYTNTIYDKLNLGPGGPAPRHELTGVWAGNTVTYGRSADIVVGERPSHTS